MRWRRDCRRGVARFAIWKRRAFQGNPEAVAKILVQANMLADAMQKQNRGLVDAQRAALDGDAAEVHGRDDKCALDGRASDVFCVCGGRGHRK